MNTSSSSHDSPNKHPSLSSRKSETHKPWIFEVTSEFLKCRTKVARVRLNVCQKVSVGDNGRLIVGAVSDKFKLEPGINYVECYTFSCAYLRKMIDYAFFHPAVPELNFC